MAAPAADGRRRRRNALSGPDDDALPSLLLESQRSEVTLIVPRSQTLVGGLTGPSRTPALTSLIL